MSPQTLAWLAALAAFIGFLVQVLKAPDLTEILARYGLPNIPAHVLPWLSLALGVAGGVLRAVVEGEPPAIAITEAIQGVLAGALPIAVHEAGTRR